MFQRYFFSSPFRSHQVLCAHRDAESICSPSTSIIGRRRARGSVRVETMAYEDTRALEEEMKKEEKPNERERDERPAGRSGGFRAKKNREKEKRPPLPSALTIKPKNHEIILASLESYDQIPLFQEFVTDVRFLHAGFEIENFSIRGNVFHGREGRRWRAAQKPAQPSRPRSDQKNHPSIDRPRQRR